MTGGRHLWIAIQILGCNGSPPRGVADSPAAGETYIWFRHDTSLWGKES